MEAWLGLASIALGAIVGTVGTLLTTRSKMRLDLQLQHDRVLMEMRLPRYQELYHLSECLPREWKPRGAPSPNDLLQMRERFHQWYFGEEAGGLFLTPSARKKYFDLQNQLQESASSDLDDLSPEDSKRLRDLASDVRHQLAEDLGTAEPPQLTWTRLGPTPAPPAASRDRSPT